MITRFSALRGIPVLTEDGRKLGLLLDLVFRPRDGDMVASHAVLVGNRLELLLERFTPGAHGFLVEFDAVEIGPGDVRVREHHD